MIKTNKKTGQQVEIPDNTPPEMVGQAIRDALARQPKTESAQEKQPEGLYMSGVSKGFANKARETISQPVMRFLANAGFPPAKNEMAAIDEWRKNHVPVRGERAGELAADVGIAAGTAAMTGGASLPVTAALMAGQHQVQHYARGEEMKPNEAALDFGMGVALPYVGKGVAAGGKYVGKRILENVVRPVGKYAGTNLEPILASARGFGKYFEGLGKVEGRTKKPLSGMVKRVSDDVAKEAENRMAMMSKGGVTGDFTKAATDAENAIVSRTPELGQRGLTPGEQGSAINAAASWIGTKPNLNAKELQGLIQKSDDVAYQAAKDINLAPQQTYSRELGRALRDQREQGINLAASIGKLSPDDMLSYKASQKALQDLKPALEAIKYRAARPSYSGGFTKDFNPFGIPVGKLVDKGITRPGTANLAYDIGRAADNPYVKYIGKKALDLARSSKFSPGDE